ncbi:MAG: hypothetical protein DPW16_17740 [Chloroflexi bacterium]|nr:hypothetical protein [Chloroflexota bacterium]
MTNSKIIERIERELGVSGLLNLLAEQLSLPDLQSLLLEVYRQQAQQQKPSQVLAAHERDRFTRPAELSPLRLLEWERAVLSELPPEFQTILLSPVCALGTSSVLGLSDQNRVMSTIYNTEVVSDSTNVLALEGALQRRKMLRENPKATNPVHLATAHRLLRTQRYENPKALPHFSAFALCSAGRDLGNWRFELTTLALHIGVYLRALRSYIGPDIRLRIAVTDFATVSSPFITRLFELLQHDFADIDCAEDADRTSGRGYYVDHCFHIYATTSSGHFVELADGGVVDWTQKLLSNAKERCVISGIGSDGVCSVWESYHNGNE